MNTTASFSSEPSWSRRCSTETIFSIQGKETDFVRDTTDTEWFGSDADAPVEYEPATEPEDEGPVASDSSGHSDNDIITTKVIEVSVGDDGELQLADSELTASSSDSEMDLHDYWLCAHCRARNNNPLYRYCEKCFQLADSELKASSSDSEMDLHDYWLCAHCRPRNNNPLYRYCEKCFQERKNFFPPRPKRKRKRTRSTRVEPEPLPRTLSQDSGVESAANSQELSQNDFGQCSQNPESIYLKNSQTSTPNGSLLKTHLKRTAKTTDSRNKRVKIDFPDSETDTDSDSSQSTSSKSNLKARSIVKSPSVQEIQTVTEKQLTNIDSNALAKTVSDSEANIDSIRSKSTLINEVEVRSIVKMVSDTESGVAPIRNKSIFNDDSEVSPLVKMVSDPALTVEEPDMKLTKKAIISTLKEKLDIDTKDNLCIVCLVEPKSGVFVHGRIAHICCCYKCAVKVWSKAKRCPVCNCKVSNVLKAVVM